MDFWTILSQVLVLLSVALVLGVVFERLRQSAILGYLVAGVVLGPATLGWVETEEVVGDIAELGVSLLLFAVGLEFSLKRLWRIGPVGLGGGTLQVLLTGAVAAIVCLALGMSGGTAVALGAMISFSSTACVLRILVDRTRIDSVYGRNALGILLLQDIAVVPLVLLVTMLASSSGGDFGQLLLAMGRSLIVFVGLTGGFWVISNYVLPHLMRASLLARNRELPILLAMVVALGSAWAAHAFGLSPALGAFVAGMVLAESPFALQIRSDIGALRTLSTVST